MGSQAGDLVVIHKSRQTENAVIPAGMQESSAMDGNSPLCKCLIQDTHQPADSPPCDWIPAVHAGMTGILHLCITARAPAWECDLGSSSFPRQDKLELENNGFPSWSFKAINLRILGAPSPSLALGWPTPSWGLALHQCPFSHSR